MTPALLPLHLGELHRHEQVLTLLLAFGPFLLLAVVVVVRRRQDRRDEERRNDDGRSGMTPERPRRR
jgi:hypothetical protein